MLRGEATFLNKWSARLQILSGLDRVSQASKNPAFTGVLVAKERLKSLAGPFGISATVIAPTNHHLATNPRLMQGIRWGLSKTADPKWARL